VLVKAFQFSMGNLLLIGMVLRPVASIATGAALPETRVDPLTMLPDRTFLLARLRALLAGDRAADREFAVLFIDLNEFKQVNDRRGHLNGDRVLREVAQRLQRSVRACDHVTRYGGDEFVVLLERVTGKSEVEPVLARIRAALAEPFTLCDECLSLSLSIGVAQSAPSLRSPEEVLEAADRAMYAAKRSAFVAVNAAPSADW
jgi:diguanylate cyclase (GGDEF)-like protein